MNNSLQPKRVHFIAIGGAAMHNLALALQLNGSQVTGSDDEIYDPSKSRLKKAGLLPEKMGWFPEQITDELDAIILGMHARPDNPELKKAQELGLNVYSYPEFVYNASKDKKRVVVAGSHGKTTTTSMIMHVLMELGRPFDYLVGAQLEGFDYMARLSDAPLIILEGDEYLSSPIDRRPKFAHYHPDVAVITGIAWDHINVFPTFDSYVDQFKLLVDEVLQEGKLIAFKADKAIDSLLEGKRNKQITRYSATEHKVEKGRTYIQIEDEWVELTIFGEHNLSNMEAARLVCNELGIIDVDFLRAMSSFKGAAKRLQLLNENGSSIVFQDFAHAPSKVIATLKAVRKQYPDKKLITCFELHTFSSLNKEFLQEYKGSLKPADEATVFYSPHTIEMKKLESISIEEVDGAFDRQDLNVFTVSDDLKNWIFSQKAGNTCLLLMSSGTFGGFDLQELADLFVE